jgi:hypothetical protein
VSAFKGMRTSMFLRLFCRAPVMVIQELSIADDSETYMYS